MTDDAEMLRGLPRELAQDIRRAAYEAKVREMENARVDGVASHQSSLDPSSDRTEAEST